MPVLGEVAAPLAATFNSPPLAKSDSFHEAFRAVAQTLTQDQSVDGSPLAAVTGQQLQFASPSETSSAVPSFAVLTAATAAIKATNTTAPTADDTLPVNEAARVSASSLFAGWASARGKIAAAGVSAVLAAVSRPAAQLTSSSVVAKPIDFSELLPTTKDITTQIEAARKQASESSAISAATNSAVLPAHASEVLGAINSAKASPLAINAQVPSSGSGDRSFTNAASTPRDSASHHDQTDGTVSSDSNKDAGKGTNPGSFAPAFDAVQAGASPASGNGAPVAAPFSDPIAANNLLKANVPQANSAPAAPARSEVAAREPSSLDGAPAFLPAAPPILPAAAHAVSTAQLAQSGGRSEMRIAMQSDNLGGIELRASVSGNSVGANITFERHDAHSALALELPALQQALSDKQLRVDQISLLHASLPAAGGESAAQQYSGQGQRGQHPSQNSSSAPSAGVETTFDLAPGLAGELGKMFDAQGRLSVHA